MPIGLILLNWDSSRGPELKTKYLERDIDFEIEYLNIFLLHTVTGWAENEAQKQVFTQYPDYNLVSWYITRIENNVLQRYIIGIILEKFETVPDIYYPLLKQIEIENVIFSNHGADLEKIFKYLYHDRIKNASKTWALPLDICTFKEIISNKISELCLGMVFDQGAVPVTTFGFSSVINSCILAGFIHAIKSFIDDLSSSIPDVEIGKDHEILNNFLNSGFYLSQFTNKYDHKSYFLLFRPINNMLFSKYWINTILKKLVNLLADTTDISQKSTKIFKTLNWILLKEIEYIEHISKFEKDITLSNILVFRKSGVRAGTIDDSGIIDMINFIINKFDFNTEINLNINGEIYEILKKTVDNIGYYKLIIHSKVENLL